MPRERTPRFVLALAALLVALQFVGVMVPVATAHATTYSPAAAPPDTSVSVSLSVVVADRADEFATCGGAGQLADPVTWPAARERHRPSLAPDAKPRARDGGGYGFTPLLPGGLPASHPAAGSSSVRRSLASLQVFRC